MSKILNGSQHRPLSAGKKEATKACSWHTGFSGITTSFERKEEFPFLVRHQALHSFNFRGKKAEINPSVRFRAQLRRMRKRILMAPRSSADILRPSTRPNDAARSLRSRRLRTPECHAPKPRATNYATVAFRLFVNFSVTRYNMASSGDHCIHNYTIRNHFLCADEDLS